MNTNSFFAKRIRKGTEQPSQFGERLRDLRKRKGYTQQQMSKIMELGLATYGTYETGRYIPDAITIAFLADFFNVSADYLLGLTDSPISENDDKAVALDFDDECLHSLSNISRSTKETRVFQLMARNHKFEEILRYIDTYLIFSQKLAKADKESYQEALEPYKRVTRLDVSTNDYLPVDVYPEGGVRIADIYISLIQGNLKSLIDDIAKENGSYYRHELTKLVSEEAAK